MKVYANFINEWAQLFGKYNWTNWNLALIQFAYENDIMLGAWELELILLGIGIRIRITKPIKTKEMLELEEMVKEIESGEATKTWKDWEEVKKELFGNCCPRCFYKLDGSEEEEENDTKN